MSEQRPAPPITMIDPTRPGEPVDVIGLRSDRDPWRPGKRSWLVLVLLVLAVAIVVPVALDRQHQSDERALDAAAAAQVSLAPTSDPRRDRELPQGVVGIGLRNDTETSVHLLGYQVLAPGYQLQHLDAVVDPYVILPEDVPDTATCAPSMLDNEPSQLKLVLRTSRGKVVTKTESLADTAGMVLARTAQQRCAYLKPSDAFSVQLNDTAAVRGRTLTSSVLLANTGRLPLTLTSVEAYDGVSISTSPRLPLVMPFAPAQQDGGSTGAPVTFRLTVTSCDLASGPTHLATDDGDVVTSAGTLLVHLHGQAGDVTTLLSLEDQEGQLMGSACGYGGAPGG